MLVLSKYEIAALITTLSTGILGSLVLAKGGRKLTRLFGIYTLAISLWSCFFLFMISTENQSTSFFWARFLHLPASIIPATYLQFTQCFLEIDNRPFQKFLRRSTFVLGGIFFILSFSHKFVNTAVREPGFPNFYMGPGPYYHLFVAFFLMTVVIIHILMFRSYRTETPFKKVQIIYLLGSYAIGYAGGIAVFLPYYGVRFPAIALYTIPVCHLAIAFSILRYRFMDLNLIFRLGLAYGLSLLVVLGLFLMVVGFIEYVLTRYYSIHRGIPIVISASGAFLVFEPMRKTMIRFVDRFIFRSPDFQVVLQGIETELKRSDTIQATTNNLAERFKTIWNVEHTGFAIWDSKDSAFNLYPSESFSDQIISRLGETITQTDFLVKTLENERRLFPFGIVIDEEVGNLMLRASAGEKITFSKIRRSLRWLGASACVPILTGDQFLGFIILGAKKTKAIYNQEDKKFLSHVAELLSERIRVLLTQSNALPTNNSADLT